MGEKTTPGAFGSFSESRLFAPARASGVANRGKPKAGGKETSKRPPRKKAAKASSTAKGRKKQTPAARAASLANLARARAARTNS